MYMLLCLFTLSNKITAIKSAFYTEKSVQKSSSLLFFCYTNIEAMLCYLTLKMSSQFHLPVTPIL